MSFGYGVGDVIAVSTLARTIWGRFRDASDQFRAIQQDVFGLHRLLDDVANNLSGLQITDEQRDSLTKLVEGCRSVLDDTEKLIQKNEILDTKSSGMSSKKILRKLKWDSATVNELRSRMISSTTYLNTFNNSLASQLSRATNDIVEGIAKDTSTLRLNQSQKDREEILGWLSPLNFAIQQCDLSSRRQAGTGDWFLESAEFQEWTKKAGETLVCQGMPGAGKTMLASRVIDHLEITSSEDKSVTVYIYCDYGKQEVQTAISLTESLMKQLLQHQDAIPEKVQQTSQYHFKNRTRPRLEEVLEMTASSMAPLSRIFLIVDALDELGNTGKVRQSFIRHLRQLQDLHHFNLMTTSREIPNIALDFHQPRCMEVRANPGDVRKYVESHIRNLSTCVEKNANLQETIANTIVDSVDGMFLLAQLHMNSLRDKTSIKMVKQALDALPKGSKALDLAYDGAMQRIDSQLEGYRHLAKQMLGWLTFSERLTSIKEVQYALAIEPGESSLDEDNLSDVTEIVGYCAGLVIVEEDTRSLRLVHYTTQEYFRQNGGKHLVATQQDIAMSCLTYLLYEEFGGGWAYELEGQDDDLPTHYYPWERARSRMSKCSHFEYAGKYYYWEGATGAWRQETPLVEYAGKYYYWGGAAGARMQKHPFLGYAARYWASHASVCGQQVIKELTMAFASDNHKVSSAGQAILMTEGKDYLCKGFESTKSRSPFTVMHVLAMIGNKAMFSELLNRGFEADTEDSSQRTPLWWATKCNQYGIVESLLSEHRVNVNKRGSTHLRWLCDNPPFISPLPEAAYHGRTSMVKLLLDHADNDINLLGLDSQTALCKAAAEGHTSIVELLLDCANIDVNTRDDGGRTPLYYAAAHNHTAIVNLLLACTDINVNSQTPDGYTPLSNAASLDRIWIAKRLLDHPSVDVNLRDKYGRTPLFDAAAHGHTSIVKLLLDYVDIDVNSPDSTRCTPLDVAVLRNYTSIVELLLDCADIDVNLRDRDGRTPLYKAASCNSDTSVVKLLLDCANIDVNARDDGGRTPLHEAATHGHASVLKRLCAHSQIDLDAKDDGGRDVFSLIAEGPAMYTIVEHKKKECLDIIRAAMEERKSGSSAQLAK